MQNCFKTFLWGPFWTSKPRELGFYFKKKKEEKKKEGDNLITAKKIKKIKMQPT